MQAHDFLFIFLLILVGSRLFGEVFSRAGLPAVLGELTAGLFLGPSLFGWVPLNDTIKILAEIGIILLLFDVGLDTNIKHLTRSGKASVIVAVGGFFLPFVLGTIAGYYLFDIDLITALFIGGTITATSIGITVRVLKDLKKHQSHEGEIVLGAAVLDDILGVILLALLYDYSKSAAVNLVDTGKVLLFIVTFFVIAPVAAKLIALLIQKFDKESRYPGLIPVSIISLVLFFAWLAHLMGAPEIIGGFAAGLALSRRFFLPFGAVIGEESSFAQRIENQMRPIIFLFTPIFFVSVGLSVNLREIEWSSSHVWLFAGTILFVSVIGKMLIPYFMRSLSPKERLIVGLSMIPRGEVGLIFAEIGRTSGIFDTEIYAALIMIIILTTMIPPLLIKMVYARME